MLLIKVRYCSDLAFSLNLSGEKEAAEIMDAPEKGPELSLYTSRSWIGGGTFGVVRKYTLKEEYESSTEVPSELAVKTVRLDEECWSKSQVREEEIAKDMAVGDLQHPNIVVCYGVEVRQRKNTALGSKLYIKMEAAQASLRDLFGLQFGLFDFDVLSTQLMSGLRFLHERGLAHRDIKPANILAFWEGIQLPQNMDDITVKLADFGLTRHIPVDTLTTWRSRSVVGTQQYLAPELLKASLSERKTLEYDAKASDMFAMGVVFFEIMFQKRPHLITVDEQWSEKNKQLMSHELKRLPLGTDRDEVHLLLVGLLEEDPVSRLESEKVADNLDHNVIKLHKALEKQDKEAIERVLPFYSKTFDQIVVGGEKLTDFVQEKCKSKKILRQNGVPIIDKCVCKGTLCVSQGGDSAMILCMHRTMH